jgi:cytoskeletal protein CcmA (bactofilin family)
MAYASVIAGSAVVRGNVRGDTSLEILGRVEGDVGVTGDLSLGPDAVVVGTVSGARVLISGSVEGDVTGTAAVVVGETGRVIGDVLAPRIGVSEGAHIQGSVRTEGSSTPSSASRSVPRAVAEPRSVAAAPVDDPLSSAHFSRARLFPRAGPERGRVLGNFSCARLAHARTYFAWGFEPRHPTG